MSPYSLIKIPKLKMLEQKYTYELINSGNGRYEVKKTSSTPATEDLAISVQARLEEAVEELILKDVHIVGKKPQSNMPAQPRRIKLTLDIEP
jgi:hypothetical protein